MTHSDPQRSTAAQIAALAIPTFGQLIAEPAFVLIDTAIIGHVGQSALAGLSLGSSVVLAAVGLCIFLAYSTTSQVARLLGAGKVRQGLQVGVDSIWLSLLIGVGLAVFLAALCEPICFALGGRTDNLAQGVAYTRAVAAGIPGMLVVYASNGVFRGLKRAGITMAAAASCAALNTVLDLWFVFGCGWGVLGSGVATGISQWFMGLFLLVPLVRRARRERVRLRPNLRSIAAAGSDGFPLFVRTLALRAAIIATVAAAAAMGTQMLAGYQIVNSLWNLAVNVLDSVAIAGQALVGTQLGARCFAEARACASATAKAGAIMGVAVGLCFAIGSPMLGQLFSDSAGIQVVVSGGLLATGLTMPMQGWMWALDGILIGSGDFRYLAATLAAAAGAYVLSLLAFSVWVVPMLAGGYERAVALWLVFGIVLMGGRALANGLRMGTDAWMTGGKAA